VPWRRALSIAVRDEKVDSGAVKPGSITLTWNAVGQLTDDIGHHRACDKIAGLAAAPMRSDEEAPWLQRGVGHAPLNCWSRRSRHVAHASGFCAAVRWSRVKS
jgi:hypothetical protein